MARHSYWLGNLYKVWRSPLLFLQMAEVAMAVPNKRHEIEKQ